MWSFFMATLNSDVAFKQFLSRNVISNKVRSLKSDLFYIVREIFTRQKELKNTKESKISREPVRSDVC